MFYGRDAELDKLQAMYDSDKFEFAVIYGRRRVGKTALIREFINNKKNLFFAASESTASDNLLSLSRRIGGSNHAPVYTDYESALAAIFKKAENERLIFVIDEFPYLAWAYRGVSSLLQILIDNNKDDSKLMLILCGSSMSFMENQVLGYKSPLYGRGTAQFRVLPFTFFESLPFFTGFNDEDKAVLYGVTGGVPEYLSNINPNKSVRDNIIDLFLSPSGRLFEEPSNLIKQELREPSTYNVIIEAISSGSSRLNEIATKCNTESNKCAKYLTSLIALGLVKKEYPYGETAVKRSIYKLEDNMFKFYYRFVFPNMSAVISGLGDALYENEIEGQLNAYMGPIFEDICKQWLFTRAHIEGGEGTPFYFGNAGRWWGTNPVTRAQEEIDLMAAREDNALFAECKWKNLSVDIDVYHELKRKSAMFTYLNAYYYIFMKKDAASRLKKESSTGNVRLITFGSMME